ncbi:MAG: SPOR domain-containing protein [Pseudomonadota bacterium]
MQKSQLRRLALDHAHGELQSDDYVRERGELIDAIAEGRLAIKREPDPPPRRPPPDEQEQTVARKTEDSAGISPAFIAVGIAVLAVLAWAGWSLLVPAPPPPAPIAAPAPAPAPVIAPAESLVTAFVADNNWNQASTERFLGKWRELSDSERDDARSAPWFRSMTAALRQQVNAHHALAGLNGGGADREDGLRLVRFARDLGIKTKFPDFGASEEPSTAPVETGEAAESDRLVDTRSAEPESSEASVSVEPDEAVTDSGIPGTSEAAVDAAHSVPEETAQSTSKAEPGDATESGADWLAKAPVDRHALQLHAVTQLDKVRELVTRYPSVELRIVQTAASRATPTYRVMHGAFASVDAAKSAFAQLPAGLREGQSFALVKSLDALRAEGERGISLPDTSDPYTLQLFAFGSRDNADRLLGRFPQLDLRVHHSGTNESRHRVLMGRFQSVQAALAAAEALPPALLQETDGPPVVKLARDPDGAAVTR